MSVSGLSNRHVNEAVRLVQQAAILGYRHNASIHYTQGQLRWQGLDRHRVAANGDYPNWADCSAFATWCLAQALLYRFHKGDSVNGCHWGAGYTGTLLAHGRAVSFPSAGDLIIYGTSWPGEHVTVYTGGGLCVSHGNEAGPSLIPWKYRPEILSIRRYI